MVKIPIELWAELLSLVDSNLRHVTRGGVGSYPKLSKLVWKLFKEGAFRNIDIRKFGLIHSVIRDFSRLERIEESSDGQRQKSHNSTH